MIQIKRNFIFSLEKRKINEVSIVNNVPIRLKVNFKGISIILFTGFRVDVTDWDSNKELVKKGVVNKSGQNATMINAKLQEMTVALNNLFITCESKSIYPERDDIVSTIQKLKSKGKLKEDKNSELSFFNVFDDFTKTNGKLNNWSQATYTKFSSVKRHLEKFKIDLTFDYLNEDGLTEYVYFLQEKKLMKNTTVKKQIGFLTWFLKWSFHKKYHQNSAYQTFKPKIISIPKPVIFLSQEERKQIEEIQIPSTKEYLERVRDVFLFTCFTGLRFSDVKNLKRSDVKKDYFELVTIKTSDTLRIELNKHSKAIIDKYQHIPFKDGKVLPVISNQNMNLYIKELGELAEINTPVKITYFRGNKRNEEVFPKYELLSTHVGRRTFICTALALGIPVEVVMKWTGHSDYKSMKPYIDIADQTKKNNMEKFDLL